MKINLTIRRHPTCPATTPRVRAVCCNFGLDTVPDPVCVVDGLRLDLSPGTITLLCGPSGSGKSAVLGAVEDKFLAHACAVHRAALPSDRAVMDCIYDEGSCRLQGTPGPAAFSEALGVLTACGLGEPKLWLRSFDELSEGEQFRAKLAWCVAAVNRGAHAVEDLNPIRDIARIDKDNGSRILLCDEFCNGLHRLAARAIAYNLRKLTTRCALTVLVATCHEDIVTDLRPDNIIQLGASSLSRGRDRVGARRFKR